jgi:hypothetical protein
MLEHFLKDTEKKIGIVLLSKDGYYIGDKGQLPARPPFDKELITHLAEGEVVLCSENTYKTIPPSIKKVVKDLTTDVDSDWTVNFGIQTFREKCDIFYIIHSKEDLGGGKLFNLERIKDMYKTEDKLWVDGYTVSEFR